MIDIHMHTVYSDGDKTVEEVLKMCEEKKLEYISITDHDTCKQYEDEAIINNNIFTGKIIKGTELHAKFQNKNIEILGYGIDTDVMNEWLQKYYSDEKLREQQVIFSQRLMDIFDKHGIIYDKTKFKKPEKPTDYVEQPMYWEILKNDKNREILGEFADSFTLFFRKGLANPNSSYFMNHIEFKPTAKEVVDIIHKSGGKAFLAHPFEYKFDDTMKFVENLRKEAELDGIECFHPSSVDDDKKDILVKYVRENGLYISGGSDFHGSPKPDLQIGVGRGNISIPKEIIEEWI